VGLSWVSQVGMPLPIAAQLPLGTWNCQRQLVLNNAGDGGTPKWTGSKKVNLISSVCNNCRSSFVLRLSFSALSLTANSRITIADTETHHSLRPPILHIVLQDCRLRNGSFDLSLTQRKSH